MPWELEGLLNCFPVFADPRRQHTEMTHNNSYESVGALSTSMFDGSRPKIARYTPSKPRHQCAAHTEPWPS